MSEHEDEPRVLPDRSEDDRDTGWGEREDGGDQDHDDERFLRDRPPHWG